MSFIEWMNMNMLMDIAFLVFAAATIWKLRKFQKRLNNIESDLFTTMRNPQAAKRLLKERQK